MTCDLFECMETTHDNRRCNGKFAARCRKEDLATARPNHCCRWLFQILLVRSHVMVRMKQPGRRTNYAQFLGLLPRPGGTKTYGQPDSSSDNRREPNSVHSNDTACANGRAGFYVIKEQAVHSPFLPTSGAEIGTLQISTLSSCHC